MPFIWRNRFNRFPKLEGYKYFGYACYFFVYHCVYRGCFLTLFGGSVDSVLMKVCSYIPFTSPIVMFTRIAMSSVSRL